MWNNPPTSPIFEGEQRVFEIVNIGGTAQSTFPFDSIDQQSEPVFRGYPLFHRNFFVVPQNGSLVFIGFSGKPERFKLYGRWPDG